MMLGGLQRTRILGQIGLRVEQIYLLIILLLGVMVPLFSLVGGFHVAGGDMVHPELGVSKSLERIMFSWQSDKGLGVNEATTIPALPYYASVWLLEAMGFSATVTQKLLLIAVFALAGASMFYLTRTLFPGKKYVHAAFIASLFYLFNFFNLEVFWQPYFNYQLAYAMTPLLLGIVAKGLRTGEKKYLGYFILMAVVNVPTAINSALIAVQVFVFSSFAIGMLVLSDIKVKLAKRIGQYGLAFLVCKCFMDYPFKCLVLHGSVQLWARFNNFSKYFWSNLSNRSIWNSYKHYETFGFCMVFQRWS